MFDGLLGNVFGRSKKQNNTKDNTNVGPNGESMSSEGYVYVPTGNPTEAMAEEPHSMYPRVTTMLTQEMIVGQTSSSTVTSVQRSVTQTYNSPIDNIPFSSALSSGLEVMDPNAVSVVKCLETIDRIQQYLSSKSQSEYNFHLENTILSESLLS